MSCKICGRSNCTSSFHSLKEQEDYEKYSSLDERELRSECMDKDAFIADLLKQLEKLDKLEAAGVDNWEGYDDAMKLEV